MFRKGFAVLAGMLLLGAGLMFAPGCGWAEKRDVKATTTAFLDAAGKGDTPAVEQRLTTKARENVAALEAFLNHGESSEDHKDHQRQDDSDRVTVYQVGEPDIEDGIATVPVVFKDKDGETPGRVRLKREQEEWRVYSVAAQFIPGKPMIEFNLENPDGLIVEMMRGLGQGVGQTIRAAEKGLQGFLEGMAQGMKENPGAEIREVPTPSAEKN